VFRMQSGSPEFLLVTARGQPMEWVFPKGHIDAGERPEEAAVREVAEESGVRAVVSRPLDDVVVVVDGQTQRIRYFLMSARKESSPREGRRVTWLPAAAAMRRLTFTEARGTLAKALTAPELRPSE
jgi:diadenosine hexaphosphate hydrolase (ATP-forming)